MTFTWATSSYNAMGSLTKFMKANINTNLPSIFTANIEVRYFMPDVPLFDETHGDYAPKFSYIDLGGYDEAVSEGDLLDGNQRGQKVYHVSEISCWVNGKTSISVTNENWMRDLMVMRDMVVKLFSANRTIQIYDLLSSTSNPSLTGYILRIDKVQEVDAPADPNPNVFRKRILLNSCYYQRQ